MWSRRGRGRAMNSKVPTYEDVPNLAMGHGRGRARPLSGLLPTRPGVSLVSDTSQPAKQSENSETRPSEMVSDTARPRDTLSEGEKNTMGQFPGGTDTLRPSEVGERSSENYGGRETDTERPTGTEIYSGEDTQSGGNAETQRLSENARGTDTERPCDSGTDTPSLGVGEGGTKTPSRPILSFESLVTEKIFGSRESVYEFMKQWSDDNINPLVKVSVSLH